VLPRLLFDRLTTPFDILTGTFHRVASCERAKRTDNNSAANSDAEILLIIFDPQL
jgi:hypothetical protein